MADKIVILEDSEGNNIYPISRGLATNSVDTNAIQNGAVTSAKIDWTNIWSNNSIVETKTDSNGRTGLYFQDGTLITYRKTTGSVDVTTAWGNIGLYYGTTSGNFSFAPSNGVDFISEPVVTFNVYATTTRGFMVANTSSNVPHIINSRWAIDNIGLIRPNSQTGVDFAIEITAIGRWK